jgi:hypothetical protein
MKTRFKNTLSTAVVILLMTLPFTIVGQSAQVTEIFEKYTDFDGFTSVDVSKGLFELFSEIDADDPEFDDFKKAIEGLESMKLLAYSLEEGKGDQATKDQFIEDVRKNIPLKDYQELMVVKDSDALINFYAKSEKQIIKEMIMIVDGKDEAVLLSLYGDLDLNYMAKLSKGMDMGGMHYLNKMHKKKKK